MSRFRAQSDSSKYRSRASVSALGVAIYLGATYACGCSSPSTTPRGNGSSIASGGSTGSGISFGGTGVINIDPNAAAGASDVWPSPACKGAPLAATMGAYCEGPPRTGADSATIANESGCGTTLWGVARDFIGYTQAASLNPAGMPHPDFGSHYCCGNPQGAVLVALGADDKPVYNPANVAGDYSMGGVGMTGPEPFAQWYNDTPGINLAYLVGLHLVPSGDGTTSVFASNRYFPVDGEGFGNYNDYGEDGKSHNFGFTTELHTKFKYVGGETFAFEGDDDLWVFIDKKLAIDLAGIHVAMPGEVKVDDFAARFGLSKGQIYSLDLFNAERHPAGSNFKITTSLTFVDCGLNPIVP